MNGKNYTDLNAETIDRWIEEGWEWGRPITHEAYLEAKNGKWDVLLTPTKIVPRGWLGEIRGKKLLGLASGGGQQMPVFAALGAECTVFDYSPHQLESERIVSEREGYEIRIVRGDMTKPFPFDDGEFDIIFHPVSNSFVKDVFSVFAEAFRVLRSGGIFVAGMANEVSYLVDEKEERIINKMPFDPLQNPYQMQQLENEDGGVQFSHNLEEQIGGQLKAGFVLTDIFSDTSGGGRLHELGIETYFATRAVKP